MIDDLTIWCELPTQYGIFRMYDTGDDNIRIISFGDIHELTGAVLIRIHSSCVASEIFGALDCDCDDQLQQAMELITEYEQGIIFHLNQEGRGHGLSKKIKACSLMQTENITTAKSFDRMGLEQDIRDYQAVMPWLKWLNITQIKLITNNPRKYNALAKYVTIIEKLTLTPNIRIENLDYLKSKNAELNHCLWLDSFMAEDAPIYFYSGCGIYEGFSNFSNHAIFIDDKLWQTSEHYYQAQKFDDDELRQKIHRARSPLQSKNIADAHKTHIKADWDSLKNAVMRNSLQHKFEQHEDLKELLQDTGTREIIEYNEQDRYWGNNGKGDSEGNGQNNLGKTIMQLRDEMRT